MIEKFMTVAAFHDEPIMYELHYLFPSKCSLYFYSNKTQLAIKMSEMKTCEQNYVKKYIKLLSKSLVANF